MVVFPALRALRFGQAYAAGKSFLQTGRPAKGGDSTNCPATATGGGSDDAGQTLLSCVGERLPWCACFWSLARHKFDTVLSDAAFTMPPRCR